MNYRLSKMGHCISKSETSNLKSPKITKVKKSNRQLKVGVKFKEIEFGGFIGFSTTINDFYENPSTSPNPQVSNSNEK